MSIQNESGILSLVLNFLFIQKNIDALAVHLAGKFALCWILNQWFLNIISFVGWCSQFGISAWILQKYPDPLKNRRLIIDPALLLNRLNQIINTPHGLHYRIVANFTATALKPQDTWVASTCYISMRSLISHSDVHLIAGCWGFKFGGVTWKLQWDG